MNLSFGKDKRTALDKAIDRHIEKMEQLDPTSDKYAKAAESLDKLCKAKSYNKEAGFSKDALLTAGVNLGGIALILFYEKTDVITSKALGFVTKPRL